MALMDTAGNLITLGVTYSIAKDIMKPRKTKKLYVYKKKKKK